MHKGKGKMEDIEKEKIYRLKKIKEQHKPMDYTKLKEHEKNWIREMYKKKEKKAVEMKKKMEELTKSYNVKFKSKKHRSIEENYQSERNVVRGELEKIQEKINRGKQYGLRQNVLSSTEKLKVNSEIREKFPTIAKSHQPKHMRNHMKWWFGRFGKSEWNKSVDVMNSPKIVELRNIKGNEYFQHFKNSNNSSENFTDSGEKRSKFKYRVGDEVRGVSSKFKIRASSVEGLRNVKPPIDYLREFRENRERSEQPPKAIHKGSIDSAA